MSDRPKKYILCLVMVGFLVYWMTACQNQTGAEQSEADEPIRLVDAETAADFPAADSPADMSTLPLPGESGDQPVQAEGGQDAPQTDNSSQAAEIKPETIHSGDPSPPVETLKLIFIHHSVGENWLADDNGSLGLALGDNNYFVSDTNYGWGPDGIGDRTDIGDWLDWFQDPGNLEAVLSADENYTDNYSRMPDPDPGKVNQIILFKSCFPNSNLEGRPDDPPSPGDPTTVSGAKYVYSQLLETYESMPDTLFVVITAPPVTEDDSWTPPANARGFNNWLVSDWLDDYALHNVAVFDFYNTLTSNSGDIYTNDLESEVGNHHRWWNRAVQHIQTIENDLAAYPDGDSHPNPAGSRKATMEFVPLLNFYVQRWLGEGSLESNQPTSDPAAPGPDSPQQPSESTTAGITAPIEPSDLVYLGAFRLPDGLPEIGWSWSGEALAYYPSGDPDGPADDFPGSLFGTGHNYNQLVSEIAIPVPVISQRKNLEELNTARTLQEFQDIRGELFPHLDFELPRAALAYLPLLDGETTGKMHFAWGQHLQDERPASSHGWSELDLSNPQPAGAWIIGDFSPYSVNDYLFSIPEDWAAAHLPGVRLATGRFRDGGWSGQGPSLIAYNPPDIGTPPPAGTRLSAVPLILYASTLDSETLDPSLTLNDYHHADEWSGGVWLAAGDKQAVIIAGTKGQGDCWYGFANSVVWPDDPPYPEVPEPPSDDRGWWSTNFVGQLLFYDVDDLAAVARGAMAPHEPQPYGALNIDPFLYHVNSVQQKEHLGAVAFDHERGLLYVLEPLVDEEKPIVHVWRVTG